MKVNVQAIDFNAKAELEGFINEKIVKLEQYSDKIVSADVHMRVVKPEVANNKEVMLKVAVPGEDLVATKVADTFEEAFANCMDAIKTQIVKAKEKNKK
ncbi:MAG: ribosome-associated translation inhibitor RaiA [Paludibacteraceae bacterium]|nr:ribosome-associated translation inhibitor RaiA [Paludibacteraceae bacterium]